MIKLNVFVTAAAALACVAVATSASAQEYGNRQLRYGNTSGWSYDGRDDDRGFPTNGYFPGNFAADPANATIGAAGIFGSAPWHSARPYPSQVIFGSTPARYQAACAQRYHSYDASTRSFPRRNSPRNRC